MAKSAPQKHYEASAPRVYAACLRAISELGYTVLHSDREGGVVSFNTGRSMSSWAGQDLGATVLPANDGCDLVIGGSLATRGNPMGGGSQVFSWGEKDRLTDRVFERVSAVLPDVPEPENAPAQAQGASVADELEKVGQLHKQGVLSDSEFEAAKARLLAD